jgi:hypothetical protein
MTDSTVIDLGRLDDPAAAARAARDYAVPLLAEIGVADDDELAEAAADLERRLVGSRAFAALLAAAPEGDPVRRLVHGTALAYIAQNHGEPLAAFGERVRAARHQRRDAFEARAAALDAEAERLRGLDEAGLAFEVAESAEKIRQRAELVAEIVDLEPEGRPRSALGTLREAADAACPNLSRRRRAGLVADLALDLLDVAVDPETLRRASQQKAGRR